MDNPKDIVCDAIEALDIIRQDEFEQLTNEQQQHVKKKYPTLFVRSVFYSENYYIIENRYYGNWDQNIGLDIKDIIILNEIIIVPKTHNEKIKTLLD